MSAVVDVIQEVPFGLAHEESRWPTGIGIVDIAGDDMGVKMRNAVPKEQSVELGWPKHPLDSPRHVQQFAPELNSVVLTKLSRFCDVISPPESDDIAECDVIAVEVGVEDSAFVYPEPPARLVWSTLSADGTVIAPDSPFPVIGPRPVDFRSRTVHAFETSSS
jgi:hypothetical protein